MMASVTSRVCVTKLRGINFGDVQSQRERRQAVGKRICITLGDDLVYGEITRVIDPIIKDTPQMRTFHIVTIAGRQNVSFAWDFEAGGGVALLGTAAA